MTDQDLCSCSFKNNEQRRRQQQEILSDPALGLPKSAIKKAITKKMQDKWVMKCSCEDRSKIIAAVRYENNDWYLCTLKNIIIREDYRRRGIGSELANEIMKKIRADADCLVVAGDISATSVGSMKIWEEQQGFKRVNRFCWSSKAPPTDIIHLVLFPPDESGSCL